MARRTIKRRTVAADGSEATGLAMLVAEIMEKIDREPLYALSAPQTLPIRQHDGQYRQRPIPADEEFTFKGCRIGARNQVIFEFQPMDPTKFDQLELEEKNVFGAFDGFENAATLAIGGGNVWGPVKKMWLSGEKRRRIQEVEDAETEAKKEVDDAYGSNSAFGSW